VNMNFAYGYFARIMSLMSDLVVSPCFVKVAKELMFSFQVLNFKLNLRYPFI
jgi:hypothetical protein